MHRIVVEVAVSVEIVIAIVIAVSVEISVSVKISVAVEISVAPVITVAPVIAVTFKHVSAHLSSNVAPTTPLSIKGSISFFPSIPLAA